MLVFRERLIITNQMVTVWSHQKQEWKIYSKQCCDYAVWVISSCKKGRQLVKKPQTYSFWSNNSWFTDCYMLWTQSDPTFQYYVTSSWYSGLFLDIFLKKFKNKIVRLSGEYSSECRSLRFRYQSRLENSTPPQANRHCTRVNRTSCNIK